MKKHKKTQYADLMSHFWGQSGDCWRELGTIEDIWEAMYIDQYEGEKPARSSVLRYINGSSRYPRRLRVRYQQDDGQQALYDNLVMMIHASTSMARVCAIRDKVYDWVMHQPLTDTDRAKIREAYVVGVGPEDLASVFACVLHYVIVHS